MKFPEKSLQTIPLASLVPEFLCLLPVLLHAKRILLCCCDPSTMISYQSLENYLHSDSGHHELGFLQRQQKSQTTMSLLQCLGEKWKDKLCTCLFTNVQHDLLSEEQELLGRDGTE